MQKQLTKSLNTILLNVLSSPKFRVVKSAQEFLSLSKKLTQVRMQNQFGAFGILIKVWRLQKTAH